jgi:hypothetical protein
MAGLLAYSLVLSLPPFVYEAGVAYIGIKPFFEITAAGTAPEFFPNIRKSTGFPFNPCNRTKINAKINKLK